MENLETQNTEAQTEPVNKLEDRASHDLERDFQLVSAKLSAKEALIVEMQKRIDTYESKIAEFREFVKKMEAEVRLVRQRAERDLSKNIRQSQSSFLSRFIEIVDQFDLSLKNANLEDPFVQGLNLIRKQIFQSLAAEGVQKIDCLGENFDPELHEALMTQPVDRDEQDNKVLEEIRAGYLMGSELLRSAQVVVGKKD